MYGIPRRWADPKKWMVDGFVVSMRIDSMKRCVTRNSNSTYHPSCFV